MSHENSPLDRRDFLKTAGAAGLTMSMASSALAARGAKTSGRVIGANDRINVGVLGVGGRGSYVGEVFQKVGEKNNSCQIVATFPVDLPGLPGEGADTEHLGFSMKTYPEFSRQFPGMSGRRESGSPRTPGKSIHRSPNWMR